MSDLKLPPSFEGFSTAELVTIWEGMNRRKWGDPVQSREFALAMHHLLERYKLAPVYWSRDKEQRRKDILQARKLLAPYGIDPATWADAEGNST